jgi:hypothetical protein
MYHVTNHLQLGWREPRRHFGGKGGSGQRGSLTHHRENVSSMLTLLTPLLSGQMKLFFMKVLGDAGVLGNARDLRSYLVPGNVLLCTPSENCGRGSVLTLSTK